MKDFATLLDRLRFCPTPAHRARVLATGSPEAQALLRGEVKLRSIKLAVLRALAEARCDPALFALSQEFLGDFTETLALIWPARATNAAPPSLAEVIEAQHAESLLEGWLDAAEPASRHALLRLATGKIRPIASVKAPEGQGGQVTAMLLTAQSGRVGLERLYSFGVHDGAGLVPIARVTEVSAPDRATLEAWVRDHGGAKFGPVREVASGLVADIAFDAVAHSTRHKAGLALHGARIAELRPDLDRADDLATFRTLLG